MVVSAEPNTNVAETVTARVEDVSKTAAPSVTLPDADSSSGISADNADAATISPPESAETPSVKVEQPSVETPQQTTASKTGETHGQKRESKRIAAEPRGGARVTSDDLNALLEQRERKRFERRLRPVCFKDNYRMWRLVRNDWNVNVRRPALLSSFRLLHCAKNSVGNFVWRVRHS